MSVEEVTFHGLGTPVAGTLKSPEWSAEPFPVVVQGPGWLGLRGAKLYHPYHEALLAAGFAVLVFDYRGFGDSGGSAEYLDPLDQVADYRAAVTFVSSRPELDVHKSASSKEAHSPPYLLSRIDLLRRGGG